MLINTGIRQCGVTVDKHKLRLFDILKKQYLRNTESLTSSINTVNMEEIAFQNDPLRN